MTSKTIGVPINKASSPGGIVMVKVPTPVVPGVYLYSIQENNKTR
ncbi:hypothetical protein [Bacillus sp. Marseille-Q3570]|nr:hypothetical protein [Bacillus sp. Marseille-Q3570]